VVGGVLVGMARVAREHNALGTKLYVFPLPRDVARAEEYAQKFAFGAKTVLPFEIEVLPRFL
jgi:hypothetical protein